MTLLEKLLGRDWQWYVRRANKRYESGDGALAQSDIDRARELLPENAPKSDRQKIEEAEQKIRSELFKTALQRVRKSLKSGDSERARDGLILAHRFLGGEEDEKALETLQAQVDALAFGTAAPEINDDVELEDKTSNADATLEDKWALLLGQLPFSQADKYESFGDDFKRGYLALQEGKLEEAIQHLALAEKTNPADPYVNYEYGKALLLNGKMNAAVDALAIASEDINAFAVQRMYCESLWAVKRFDEAEKVLQRAADAQPDDIEVLVTIVQHAVYAKDYESGCEAIDVLDEAIQQAASEMAGVMDAVQAGAPKPAGLDRSVTLRLRGQLSDACDRNEEAIAYYEKAIKYQSKAEGIDYSVDPV